MAKFINDAVMDAALNLIAGSAVFMAACKDQPADVAGVGTHGLGTVGFTDWTLAAGDTSGRKITAGAATIAIGTSGTVNHLAYYDADTLYVVGTVAPTAVTAGGTVTVASYDVDEIKDPS